MQDIELLELAAKAAEIVGFYSNNHPAFGEYWEEAGIWHTDENDSLASWNPLTDDGDALRLAVKLGLGIIQQHTFAGPEPVAAACGFGVEDYRLTSTDYNGDPLAATRRAIVRAAAEIGKSMQ